MRILTLALCAALAGCSTTGRFDNLITVSLTGDRAFVSSLYGPIGITAELRASDARELRAMAAKARLVDMLAGQQQPSQ